MSPKDPLSFTLRSLEATHRFAQNIAEHAFVPMVICLEGTLGAGKTEWTRAFVAALGVDPREVTSPTFMLMHEYPSQPPVVHMDAYRLPDTDAFLDLGADELFEQPCICIIEWASRVHDGLPAERLEIRWEVIAESERQVTLLAYGPRHRAWLDSMCVTKPFMP